MRKSTCCASHLTACFYVILSLFVLLGVAGGTAGSVHAATFVERAQEYITEGDLRSAEIELKNALQRDPNDAEARFLLGKVMLRQGNPVAAEKELLRARELGFASEELDLMLAYARIDQSRFNEALQVAPDATTPETEMQQDLFVARGEALLGLGEIDAAKEIFDQVLSQGPHLRALVNRARVALILDDSKSARDYLDRALALDPDDPLVAFSDANWHYQEGNYAEARDGFARTAELSRNKIPARLGEVQALLALQEIPQAEKLVQSLKATQPDNLLVVLFDAITQFLKGDQAAAKVAADRVLGAISTQPQALLVAGFSAYHLGQYEQARARLLSYLSQRPEDDRARMVLGASMMKLGQDSEAFDTLTAMDAELPQDATYLGVLANAAIGSGDRKAGVKYFERLVSKNPENAELLERLAVAQIYAGDRPLAKQNLERAIALDPARSVRPYERLFALEMQENAIADAIALADTVKERFSDKADGDLLAGIANLAGGKQDAAQAAFRSALEKEPGNLDAASYLANMLRTGGKVSEARSVLDGVLEKAPNDLEPLLAYAEFENGQRNFEKAQTFLNRAFALQPQNPSVLRALGTVAESRGNLDEAAEWNQKALDVNPRSLSARLSLARIDFKRGEIAESLALSNALASEYPNNSSVLSALGEAQRASGQRDAALRTFQRVAELTPESADTQFLLARSYADNNQPESAQVSLQKALELDPAHLRARITAVRLALSQGRIDLAQTLTEAFPAEAAENPSVLHVQSQVQMAKGEMDKAIETLATAWQTTDAQDVEAVRSIGITLARAYYVTGKPDAAAGVLEKWLADNPKDTEAQLLFANLQIARGDKAAAERTYSDVLSQDPANWAAMNDLAMLLYQRGELEKAHAMAEQAVAQSGDNAAVMDTLGVILLANKRPSDAVTVLRKASSLAPDQPQVALHLAQALVATKEVPAAKQVLDQILARPDSFAGRAEVEEFRRSLDD